MDVITNTQMWKATLGRDDYSDAGARRFVQRLRTSFISFRERVNRIASHLPSNLKELTVHDMTHIDALWEVADLLCPSELVGNPVEAYVLGGAFLLHDLGHALAAYPGGLEELRSTESWTIASSGRFITAGSEEEGRVIDDALRLNHAKHAEHLGTRSFGDVGQNASYLIEESDLRHALGASIGAIAYSHWRSPHDLDGDSRFKRQIGAPPIEDCPRSWGIDPLKIAYVLRTSDACQIDGRRAPIFVRSLRKPQGIAAEHWGAQQDLAKPYCDHGRIVFTSQVAFDESRRDSWWTALELARTADHELRAAEDFFQTEGLCLRANRVAGVSSPRSFSDYLPVQGWVPIDATPRISAVTSVISRLGGATLYGLDYTVPLRELIQNARDAVACRRALEGKPADWGEIVVRHWSEGEDEFLSVSDNGIGISEQNLLANVLDFGSSYWKSPLCQKENRGLSQTGFEPQGMFGIGFFSIFMLGNHVRVTTRRQEDGMQHTRVLEFTGGLSTRPMIRKARSDEVLYDTGTAVTVRLNEHARSPNGLLRPPQRRDLHSLNAKFRQEWPLRDLLEWLCPALDVNLRAVSSGESASAIECNDWTRLPAVELFRRMWLHIEDHEAVLQTGLAQYFASSLENITNEHGEVIGRASLIDNSTVLILRSQIRGVVTCGAFRADTSFTFVGLLLGAPKTATRFDAEPIVYRNSTPLESWATRQAFHSAASEILSLDAKVGIAAHVRFLNGDLGPLPIALHLGELVTFAELQSRVQDLDVVHLIEMNVPFLESGTEHPLRDDADGSKVGVLIGRMYAGAIVHRRRDPLARADHPAWDQYWYSLWGAAIESVAESWKCSIQSLLHNSTIVGGHELGKADELHRPPR